MISSIRQQILRQKNKKSQLQQQIQKYSRCWRWVCVKLDSKNPKVNQEDFDIFCIFAYVQYN